MKLVEILLEKKIRRRKNNKRARSYVHASSKRPPVIGFGSWYWSGGFSDGDSGDGGE